MSDPFRYGSVCSGIEAASVAWTPLGWRCAFMSEIEKFPRAVLSHHYPDTPLHGDFTTIKDGEYDPIDLLVGGTPCQSFSVAGLRGGLEDERGNLALEYLRLADRLRPRWIVWENVPGVRSSSSGRDFGAFLRGLGELRYGWAYRSLDAQYFGLAQRRERVFVVGYLGDWRRAAAVLFEPEGLRGDSAPSRAPRERVAPTITRGPPGGRTYGLDADTADSLVAGTHNSSGRGWWNSADVGATIRAQDSVTKADTLVSMCRNAHPNRLDGESQTFVTHTLRSRGYDASEDGAGRVPPLAPVAYRTSPNCGAWETGERTDALTTGTDPTSHLIHTHSVRRLTPRESERLMGFPDDYTLIPWRGGMAPDGPRYKALGNSMAVPVMAWIGRRIQKIEGARP